MSVVTFWSNGKEETGKTLSIVALATYMAIEHNYRILLLSTSLNDKTISNCFWHEEKRRKNLGIFGPNTNIAMESGIEGLAKIIKSNKVSPDIVTNYTKIVFKDRLEVLLGYEGEKGYFGAISISYPAIIEVAKRYYDIVLVDMDNELDKDIQKEILDASDLVVANLSQRLSSINEFVKTKNNSILLNSSRTLILIGRYDKYSKYTAKNITRYLKEKNIVSTLPYNTLYFEACEEAKVPDLFLRLRNNIDPEDRNAFFINEVKRLSENIMYRLQDLQTKM